MKPLVFISLMFFWAELTAQERVGVGTLTPDATAKLEVSATDKGMLIPRMTSAQRQMIPNPTNGLLVFDVSTIGFWYFDGVQWVQPFGPAGPQGPIGITGIAGPTGPQGATGNASNIIGPQGPIGVIGSQGAQGPAGTTGAQGISGIQGVVGVTGVVGAQGAAGPQGVVGVVGATGSTGAVGLQGSIGVIGLQGPQGPQGVIGTTGPNGPPSFNTAVAFGSNGLLSVTDAQSTLNAQHAVWLLTGNPSTNPTNNYIGTSDNQALNIATGGVEKMRVLGNGDVWVDGSKPFMLRRYFCNNCDDPNRNTGVSATDYIALIAGFYPVSDDGDTESTRARMYNNGGIWWFKGDLESPGDEDWSVDILFVKAEMTDDQRPNSSNGGGSSF